jgi:hypothetical protein
MPIMFRSILKSKRSRLGLKNPNMRPVYLPPSIAWRTYPPICPPGFVYTGRRAIATGRQIRPPTDAGYVLGECPAIAEKLGMPNHP